jgi:glycosyltransferase involved in cell wall biosynthesis/Flp pilus assembly protein TadD
VDTYTSNLLRLFRSHPDIRYKGIIHEQVLDSVLALGYKLENTNLKMIHYGYSHSKEQMKHKQLRNLELLTKAINNKPDDAYSIYQRAKTYLALNKLDEAEKDVSLALHLVKHDSTVRPQALNFGAVIAFQLKAYDVAISRAKESLILVPEQAFANFILGETYASLQNFPDALDAYQKMEQAGKNKNVLTQIVGDYNLPFSQLAFKIGKCLIGLKVYDAAQKEFQRGLAENPNDTSCLVGLANVEYHYNNFDNAKTLLEDALKLEPERGDILKYLEQVKSAIKLEKVQKEISSQTTNNNNKSVESEEKVSVIKPFISLSMIVKNEEKQLPDCLCSVSDIVDEIVIVDTGSTDSTKEIARKYGAKLIDFEWVGDFAAARNVSLQNCTGEWILYLDADERLVQESAQKIRNLLSNSPDYIGGYLCTLESDHIKLDGSTEKHRGGYPRLFRNYGYPNIYFQGRVHEQITPSIFALNKSIDFSDIIIEHLGYNQTREIMEAKIKRNYAMLIQHVQEEPLNAYAWYQLGQTLAQMSLIAEAEQAVRFSIQMGSLSNSVYASAAATLAQIVGNQKKFDEALYWSEQSLLKAPEQVYALHLKAYSLLYLKRYEESEQLFEEVLNRLKAKQGVPHAGFDIVIPEDVIMHGLNEARKRGK